MRAYFDTACLVKCYVSEAGSAATWRLAATLGRIYCSAFGRIELISGLRRAHRERRVGSRAFSEILLQLSDDDRRSTWEWIPVSEAIFEDARVQVASLPPAIVLRAGDALHLSTARLGGFDAIWSTDQRLLAAAPHFGLEGRDPTD